MTSKIVILYLKTGTSKLLIRQKTNFRFMRYLRKIPINIQRLKKNSRGYEIHTQGRLNSRNHHQYFRQGQERHNLGTIQRIFGQ